MVISSVLEGSYCAPLQGLISFSSVLLHQSCLGRSPQATLAGITPRGHHGFWLLVGKTSIGRLVAPSPCPHQRAASSQAITPLLSTVEAMPGGLLSQHLDAFQAEGPELGSRRTRQGGQHTGDIRARNGTRRDNRTALAGRKPAQPQSYTR